MTGPPGRAQLLRDLVVLQIKLFVDGLRDLLMSPVALFAALFGLLVGKPHAIQVFYDVVRFGRRTERWIDPFSAGGPVEHGPEPSLDEVLSGLEGQLKSGAISGAARQAVEQALAALRRPPSPPR